MDAYAERKPVKNYTRVLSEMQEVTVVAQIREVAMAITRNEVGQSTIDAEFWADTLDRWAEQLVDPMGDSEPMSTELVELPNLTPEIILEVLRIINSEIELREETRELDQAIGAIDQETYEQRGAELSVTQAELTTMSREGERPPTEEEQLEALYQRLIREDPTLGRTPKAALMPRLKAMLAHGEGKNLRPEKSMRQRRMTFGLYLSGLIESGQVERFDQDLKRVHDVGSPEIVRQSRQKERGQTADLAGKGSRGQER